VYNVPPSYLMPSPCHRPAARDPTLYRPSPTPRPAYHLDVSPCRGPRDDDRTSLLPADFLTPRLHRWLTALIILGTVAVVFVVINDVVSLVAVLQRRDHDLLPGLAAGLHPEFRSPARWFTWSRGSAPGAGLILVYALLIVLLVAAILLVAQQLYSSINSLIVGLNTLDLRQTLQPYQDRPELHRRQPDQLYDQVNSLLAN